MFVKFCSSGMNLLTETALDTKFWAHCRQRKAVQQETKKKKRPPNPWNAPPPFAENYKNNQPNNSTTFSINTVIIETEHGRGTLRKDKHEIRQTIAVEIGAFVGETPLNCAIFFGVLSVLVIFDLALVWYRRIIRGSLRVSMNSRTTDC